LSIPAVTTEEKAKRAEYGRKWRAKPENKARQVEYARKKLANPEFKARKLHAERARLYNMSPEELRSFLAMTDGKCPLCHEERPLHVDHCHITGENRLPICSECNRLEGAIRKNPERAGNVLHFIDAWNDELRRRGVIE